MKDDEPRLEARIRLLIVFERMKHPVTVRELQDDCALISGCKPPGRKTIYADIATIERLYPIRRWRKNNKCYYQIYKIK